MNSKHFGKTIDARASKRALQWGISGFLAAVVIASTSFASVAHVAASTGVDGEGAPCSECYRVDAIVVEGLLRTHREVVERELLFEEGDVATIDDVEESVQRLRNTGIFRTVNYEFVDHRIGVQGTLEDSAKSEMMGPDEGRLLRLTVDERWTLSPSFAFGQGGDTFRLRLGLSDVNVGGTYLQAGGSYSRLGYANSFSLWFRDPRFLDARQEVSTRGSLSNRLYTFYDDEAAIEGGFMVTRRNVALGIGREWTRMFRSGANISFSADTFSYEMISDERREAQDARGGLYDPMQTVGFELNTRLGRMNRDEYKVHGTTLDAQVVQYLHFGDVEPRSRRFRATLNHFVDLPYDATFGMRGAIGFSSVEPLHMQYFVGGLDALRGTYDNRHRGRHYWLGNLEFRIPSIQNNWVVLQHVAFIDAVGVSQFATEVLDLTAATTGLGVRIISRDFHGLVLRFDYALPVMGADGPGFSFGAGQFF